MWNIFRDSNLLRIHVYRIMKKAVLMLRVFCTQVYNSQQYHQVLFTEIIFCMFYKISTCH